MKTEILIDITKEKLKVFEWKGKKAIFKLTTQDSDLIADCYNKDHAAYICKAVNNHEALLSALKDFCDLRTAYSNEDFNNAYHKAKEAIKQAEESI